MPLYPKSPLSLPLCRARLLMAQWLLAAACAGAAAPLVQQDPAHQQLTLSDASRNLVLHLSYDHRCLLDSVRVGGREVVVPDTGVCSALKVGGQWFTTRSGIPTPQVQVQSNRVDVSGIRFGGGGLEVSETWAFTVEPERIVWRVDRTYLTEGTLEDTYFPGWDFRDMSTWTGALLGHGGVAWTKLFDAPNASYGVHNGKATFWKQGQSVCLRLEPESPTGSKVACRFSRQPSGVWSFNYSVTGQELVPQHGLSRFSRSHQDIWRPFAVHPGRVSVQLTLSAPAYDQVCPLNVLPGLDADAVRQICHTIARIGAVDEHLLGSNGYYSDYAVLHEPWLAQMGLAIDDPDYFRAYADTLDFERQHAIGPDGRVKSRWSGKPGDAMPGTYDAFGYYECQWGWLMDSQTSWAINVADQFDFTGDRPWLQRQKRTGESVLDYLLRRDTDGDGLVKMMTASEREARGSDWIDVVWAAHENALVNAQMYSALARWAELEELLGDHDQAQRYGAAAAKLKHRFNQDIRDGGFWDPADGCYAYWRDQDGSVHGTNFVVPVNFSAIGYGLCDIPERRAAILDRLEAQMQQENLFFWPLCLSSYAKEEGHPKVNWPFPRYENGDLFLAWGELGTRSYAAYQPAVALQYVKNVLAQYARDGLAFQRYLRKSQAGAGNDILANNCSTVVGLYRNLYGLQPKYNRLYLEPHLTPELNGTQLKYWLRGKEYRIDLSVNDYCIAVDGFSVHDPKPFAVATDGAEVEYFHGASPTPALAVRLADAAPFELRITTWPEAPPGEREWGETCGRPAASARHELSGLATNTLYRLSCNDAPSESLRSDAAGRLTFRHQFQDASPQKFRLQPASETR